MSLRRVVAKLPLRTCLQAAGVLQSRPLSNQNNFEGVNSAYCWDHESGFGENEQGQLVLVSPENKQLHNVSEAAFWETLISPVPLLDHSKLLDELQMNVLAYDDDSLCIDASEVHSTKLPIYKGHLSQFNDFTPDTDPFITGGTTGNPEKTSGGGSDSPQQACA